MKHFYLTTRQVNSHGQINARKVEPAKLLHYCTYSVPDTIEQAHKDNPVVEPLEPDQNLIEKDSLINKIRMLVEQLPDDKKEVLFFIHGYVPLKGIVLGQVNLNILWQLHQKYVLNPKTNLGLIIFLDWPAGIQLYKIEDNAHQMGERLYKNYHQSIVELGTHIRSVHPNARFHMMAQSFGNRLLNGFLTQVEEELEIFQQPVFDKTFLLCADVPIEAASKGGTEVKLNSKKVRPYRMDKLAHLSKEVIVFADKSDLILWGSKLVLMRQQNRLGIKGLPKDCPDNFQIRYLHEMGLSKSPSYSKALSRHRYFYTRPRVVERLVGFF